MDERYDIFEFISQREDPEMSPENADLVSLASIFRSPKGDGGENETESCKSPNDVTFE